MCKATLLLALLWGTASAEPARIEVEAAIDPETGAVSGRAVWTGRNLGPRPIERVPLFLYPEVYRDDPDLEDILLERVYPSAFESGTQVVLAARSAAGDAPTTEVSVSPGEDPDGPPLVWVPLPEPAPPGAAFRVELLYEGRVPRKYGTFGRFRGVLTMNGGLAPLPVQQGPDGSWLLDAPPARLARDVEVELPDTWGGVVGSVVVEPALGPADFPFSRLVEGGSAVPFVADALGPGVAAPPRGEASPGHRRVRWVSEAARWTAVSLRRRFHQQNLPLSDGSTLTFVGRPLRRGQARWVRLAAEGAREVLRARGVAVPRGVVLLEAPLRRRMVELGDGVVYVSDRYLEVERPFWRYLDIHLGRVLVADGLRELVEAREDPRLLPFVQDGVSWGLAGDYVAARWKAHLNLRALLDRLSFIPQVDDLLQTPIFPFADQIFDNPYVVDPLRADVRRFNRPLRGGRVLFLRFDDEVGEDTQRQALLDWPAEGPSAPDYFARLEARSGVPVRETALAWLKGVPRVNLRIEPLRRARTEDGRHRTTVRVRRELLAGEAAPEPVEVLLRPAHPPFRRGELRLRWDGEGDEASWTVETPRAVGVAEVDPRGRVLEVDEYGLSLKRDNRRPVPIKPTFWGYFYSADPTSRAFDAAAGFNLRPAHDLRHRFSARLFADERTWGGASFSYTRYFGRPRIGGYRRHRVTGSVDAQWLNSDFRPTEAPVLVELGAAYVFDSRTWAFAPTRGSRFVAEIFGGKDFALRDDLARPFLETAYLGFDLEGQHIFRLHPWHLLALRARFGATLGNVRHSQFSLGGYEEVRGLPAGAEVGPVRTMATVEWRHSFVRDLDLWAFFSRLRSIQGALFVEAGVVSDSLTQLPKDGQAAWALGYGVRFFVDFLGFMPGMFGIDVAWTPGGPPGRWPVFALPQDWPEVPFQVYLVGTQSF